MNYLCCFCKQRNEINKLKAADNSIPLFSLNNHKYKAKVVNVYDGDTIKVVILFHNKLTRFSLRMTGYDSPELRTKNQNEKAAAIKARDALSSKINNKIIDLHCGKFDKYGRLWIQTDGNYSNSGDFKGMGNNQMLIADTNTGKIKRFMVGPKECEVTGLTFAPDYKTVFVGIQHPGERLGSNFPDNRNNKPRSCIIAIQKKDGSEILT